MMTSNNQRQTNYQGAIIGQYTFIQPAKSILQKKKFVLIIVTMTHYNALSAP